MVIAVICEGETEETFIKRILSPDLESHGKTLKPFLLGGLEQGGYPKLAKEVRKRLHERGIAYVTTMVDLYGLPKNFPQKSTAPSEPYERVQFLEEALPKISVMSDLFHISCCMSLRHCCWRRQP
jgi:hypothetical protein